MPAKISGIAVYPLQKLKLKDENLPENKKYEPDNLIKISSKCKSNKVPCTNKVNLRMESRVEYQIVCAIKCDNPGEVEDYSVKGSVEKTGRVIPDYDLPKRSLSIVDKDAKGFYRQWWAWNNKFGDWKEAGIYNVTLRLIDKNDKKADEITIPVNFSKTNYPTEGLDIDSMC
jgi:hypothetical protein